ncbi:MAG: replicative DNA helicase [Clostridiales bacterium]|nr:replicative DNA helicase [Clostridiales bacterium]
MSQQNIAGGRIPPHNLDAEKSLLGAMILSQKAASQGIERLNSEDFYLGAHARIFESMIELAAKGNSIDLITLSDRLETDGALEAVGGPSYVAELSQFVPTASNMQQYINIVKSDSTLRRLIEASGEITDECYEDTLELSQILAGAEKRIFDISQKENKRSFVNMKQGVSETLKTIEERYANPSAVTGLKSGFPTMDKRLTGFQPGQLILIAARPSMGKTALMLDIAQQTARLNDDAKIAVFQLEMPYEHLIERMISGIGSIPLQNIRTGRLTDKNWDTLNETADTLSDCKIFIDDSSGVTVMEMLSKCRRLKIEHGLSLVIIDYLQLMSSVGKRQSESRQQEVSSITRALKLMARELEVPVILGSQLSRAPEQRVDHHPMLSDLRESGAIEQDADIVMFIYRDDYYKQKEGRTDEITNIAEIMIAKQRNGPTGTVELSWDAENASFRDITTVYD